MRFVVLLILCVFPVVFAPNIWREVGTTAGWKIYINPDFSGIHISQSVSNKNSFHATKEYGRSTTRCHYSPRRWHTRRDSKACSKRQEKRLPSAYYSFKKQKKLNTVPYNGLDNWLTMDIALMMIYIVMVFTGFACCGCVLAGFGGYCTAKYLKIFEKKHYVNSDANIV
eukprot:544678_1